MQALTIPFGYSIQATPTEAFGLKTITSWSAASDPENQDKGTMELVVQRENQNLSFQLSTSSASPVIGFEKKIYKSCNFFN